MSGIERTKTTALAQLEEICATARIWKSYSEILVPQSGSLFPILDNPAKQKLHAVLKDKTTDSSALYRGLTIQLHSVFEGFIRSIVGSVIDEKCSKVACYSELDKRLRVEHLVTSSKVLTYLKAGSVNGIRHDFDQTEKNLVSCLTKSEDYRINKEAFTLLLGNCTPDRLETLFDAIGIPSPFSETIGESKILQDWAGEKSKKRISAKVKEELSNQLDLRNEIVHGNVTKAISQTKFETTSIFFSGLIEGITIVAFKSI